VDLPFLGFAFVYFEDERDGDDAIRALDGYPFGPGRRRLSVEWSRVISLALLA
jgi:arginine/serine-rich splicing factor 4/5/6